jgi:hypothetical protein
VDIHLEPIVDSQGHLMGFISIEKDVTKEESHQNELGELSASIYEELVKKVGKNGGSPLGAKGIQQAVVPISLGRTRNGKQTR